MAKNKLSHLNNHLFAQMERLSDEDLKGEELQEEMKRAKAISNIARNIVDNAKTTLEAAKFTYKYLPGNEKLPEIFEVKKLEQ